MLIRTKSCLYKTSLPAPKYSYETILPKHVQVWEESSNIPACIIVHPAAELRPKYRNLVSFYLS